MVVLRLIGCSDSAVWVAKEKKVVSIASLDEPLESSLQKICDKLAIRGGACTVHFVAKAAATKWKGPPEFLVVTPSPLDAALPLSRQGISASGDFLFVTTSDGLLPEWAGVEPPRQQPVAASAPAKASVPTPPARRHVSVPPPLQRIPQSPSQSASATFSSAMSFSPAEAQRTPASAASAASQQQRASGFSSGSASPVGAPSPQGHINYYEPPQQLPGRSRTQPPASPSPAQLEAAQREVAGMRGQLADMQAKLACAADREQTLADTQRELAQARERLRVEQAHRATLEAELQRARSDLVAAEESVGRRVEAETAALRDDIVTLRGTHLDAKAEALALQQRLAEAAAYLKEVEWEGGRARALLEEEAARLRLQVGSRDRQISALRKDEQARVRAEREGGRAACAEHHLRAVCLLSPVEAEGREAVQSEEANARESIQAYARAPMAWMPASVVDVNTAAFSTDVRRDLSWSRKNTPTRLCLFG